MWHFQFLRNNIAAYFHATLMQKYLFFPYNIPGHFSLKALGYSQQKFRDFLDKTTN